MKRLYILILALILCSNVDGYSQDTIRVPFDFQTIQEALDTAQVGATILVSPGIYYERINWPIDSDDISLVGVEGAEETIISGVQISNNHRVLSIPGLPASEIEDYNSCLVQGFTIRDSGGLYVGHINALLIDLIIRDNESQKGGGIHLIGHNGTIIKNCKIINNTVEHSFGSPNNGFASGGGMELTILEGHTAVIDDCDFVNNKVVSDYRSLGGAIHVGSTYGNVYIVNCLFENNSIMTYENGGINQGGAINIDNFALIEAKIDSTIFIRNTIRQDGVENLLSDGGAIYFHSNKLEISECIFEKNVGSRGGALNVVPLGNPECRISNSLFSENKLIPGFFNSIEPTSGSALYGGENVELQNCVIYQNSGNTIYSESDSLNLNHCTIAYNTGHLNVKNLSSKNTIFWDNGTAEIVGIDNDGEFDLQNCIVANGFDGVSILDIDPQFISQFSLIPTVNSPCNGRGVLTDLEFDIDGISRPQPIGTNPDIGAYEINHPVPFIDEDNDGFNNYDDCDDHDASINPNATEIINNDIDEDCDGVALTEVHDIDGVKLSIYPNPTFGLIFIEKEKNINLEIRLINMIGQVLVQSTSYSEEIHQIDIHGLNSGAYLIEIINSQSQSRIIETLYKIQ